MKAAFSVWDNRIAPVFDVARHVLLMETKSGQIFRETRETLADTTPVQKAVILVERDVGLLVCGAISRPLQDMIPAYGIRMLPFVAGDLRGVVFVFSVHVA